MADVHLYFGTINRGAPLDRGGALVHMRWADKHILGSVPVRPENPDLRDDPNPRGNSRGCRGLCVRGDEIYAADYHSVLVFDRALGMRRRLSNGLLVGNHEMYLRRDGSMWVACTAIDAMVRIDTQTGQVLESCWPRERDTFQRQLGLTPLDIDKQADNRARFLDPGDSRSPSHLHLNAVVERGGEVFALFNAFGVVASLTGDRIVIKDQELRRAHNLTLLNDDVVMINDTTRSAVRFYHLDTGRCERVLSMRRSVRMWRVMAEPIARRVSEAVFRPTRRKAGRLGFQRGLALQDGRRLFVGISPATIVEVDLSTGRVVDACRYSTDANVAVHGLAVVSDP